MNQEFLKPRLIGARFDDHSIPLELLKDFAALEEMLVEVAKWRFKESHPERGRIRRGFSKGTELHLSAVEKGSAKAVIALAFSGLFPTESVTYFEQARVDVIEAIASAAQGVAPSLPTHLLGYFDRFGRGLRDGESMEFSRASGELVRLDTDVRRRLIRLSQADEWTEELALRGRISEADQARQSFELELRDGTRLKAPLSAQHLDSVLDAFKGYRGNSHVLIQGVVKKDRQDRLKAFDSVEHVSLLEPLDIGLRLEELGLLRDGWLDGKGVAPNKQGLQRLAENFETHFDAEIPLPHLYPTAEGGAQAEWALGAWEVSIEIDLQTQRGEYQAVNLEGQETHEQLLALDAPEGWATLNAALKQFGVRA